MPVILIFFVLLSACQQNQVSTYDVQGDFTDQPGWVSVFQTFTGESETSINILRPRLTDMIYKISEHKEGAPLDWSEAAEQELKKTTSGPQIHWKLDRIHVKGLDPKKNYRLGVFQKRTGKLIDWRIFSSLKIKEDKARFVMGSCMSDSHAFSHVREKIWDRMLTHNPDFIVLLGDQVYVDDFDFVKRGDVSEFDIWTRYIDSLRKIPLFQNRQLVPLLAVWDDHDYGTNNSDKSFKSKKAAKEIFTAFFGGEEIKGVIDKEDQGIYFSFEGYDQKFLFMDNRYFREPDPKQSYGHWGKPQHDWFEKHLSGAKKPVWIANGGQFFTNATFVDQGEGKAKKQINESFVAGHPGHFKKLVEDIKKADSPVMFLSGDIHYSEIAEIEKEVLGYQTYEITSSPVHSYIYRAKEGPETWLDNPRRVVSVKEHNYLLVESEAKNGAVSVKVRSYGVQKEEPYFEKTLSVQAK